MTKSTDKIDLLSTEGKQLMELKEVLLANQDNPLIYDALIQTIQSKGLQKKVVDSLQDNKVDKEKFEKVIINYKAYTNEELAKKTYSNFRLKVNSSLDRHRVDHYQSGISLEDGGIYVFKKIGFNQDYLAREFRLNKREVNKLIKDGFAERYASLKLTALTKTMFEHVEHEHGKVPGTSLALSDFYYDEDSGYYNIDFKINVAYSAAYDSASTLTNLVKDIKAILDSIHIQFMKNIKK